MHLAHPVTAHCQSCSDAERQLLMHVCSLAGVPFDTAQGAGAAAGPHRTVFELLTGFEQLHI